jgi:uracil-DNA glycosylase
MEVKIEKSWKKILADEFNSKYFSEIATKVKEAYKTKKVYPKASMIFNAFDLCPFD